MIERRNASKTLKRSTLMQEEQSGKEKRHRKMSYNETEKGERSGTSEMVRLFLLYPACAICVLVFFFFFFLHYTCVIILYL